MVWVRVRCSGEGARGGDVGCESCCGPSGCCDIFEGVDGSSIFGAFFPLPAFSFPGIGFFADMMPLPSTWSTPPPRPAGNGGRRGTLAGEPVRPPGPNLLSPGGLPSRCGEDSRLLLEARRSSRLLALVKHFLSTRTGLEIWTLSLMALCFEYGCGWTCGFFCLP